MKKRSKIILFSSLCLMFILSMGLFFVKPVYAKASYIPNDYRLLTSNDVGKTFGTDLELNVYFDTEVSMQHLDYVETTAPDNNVGQLTNLFKAVRYYSGAADEWFNALRTIDGADYTFSDYSGNLYYSGVSGGIWAVQNPVLVAENISITYYNTDYEWNTFFYVKDISTEPDPIPGVENEFEPLMWNYQSSAIIYEYTNATNEYQSSLYIPKFNEIGSSFTDYRYFETFYQGQQDYMVEVSNMNVGAETEVYALKSTYYLPNNTEYLAPHINIYFGNFVYLFDDAPVGSYKYLPILYLYKFDNNYEFELQSIDFVLYDFNGVKHNLSFDVSNTSEGFVLDETDYTLYHLSYALRYEVLGLSSNIRNAPIYVESVNINLGYPNEYINSTNVLRKSFALTQALNSNFFNGSSFQDYLNNLTRIEPIGPIDMSSWLLTSVGAFMDAELFPGFALGGLLAVIIAFPVVVWFLKMLAGG